MVWMSMCVKMMLIWTNGVYENTEFEMTDI